MPSAADISIPASLAAVAFLGAGLTLGLVLTAALIAIWRRAPRLGTWLLGAGGALAIGYGTALGAASLHSRDRVLAPGGTKYFCEIDCHLAYSIAGVERPSGDELVVQVTVRFDPESVGAGRGDGPLWPNPRLVELVDASGRRYPVSLEETERYREAQGARASLHDPLRPGESYTVPLVFEIPPGIQEMRLWITGGDWVNRLLIGHERSPGHGKVYLALDRRGSTAGREGQS